MWGKNHCLTHRVFELNMNFQMLLFFVCPYDISRFLRFRTICVIFRQFFFLHIFAHGVYMKLDNIFFSSPKIICVSWDIICGCPYDIHGIAQQWQKNWFHYKYEPRPLDMAWVIAHAHHYSRSYKVRRMKYSSPQCCQIVFLSANLYIQF